MTDLIIFDYNYIINRSSELNRLKYKFPMDSMNKFSKIKNKLNIKESNDFKRLNISIDKTVINKKKEELGELYKYLNKITDKTYDRLLKEILNSIQNIEDIVDQKEICSQIFKIITTNHFYSEIYAKLFLEMIKIHNSFKTVFDEQFKEYINSFNTIEYTSSNENYDKYCSYIKKIDSIKSSTFFFINCMKYQICSSNEIIDLVLLFQKKMIDQLEFEQHIYENLQYIENIYIIIKENYDILSFHEKWDFVIRNNCYLKENNGPGKNNKIRFKLMDIDDFIQKMENN